jgi:3-hydroxyisobutyryl-CoA hydrolase
MIAGAGSKAFCAGGDVAALALQNEKGPEGQKESTDYFALEYQLDHLIATYSKPYVAVMDGITMGGGVGLSVHAPFRIATERTVFAMPETTIGFFPDVGGSFFLSRLDGEVGLYLAMTSERLNGVQAFYAGIATHYMHSSSLGNLTARLAELGFHDHATLGERLELVNKTIAEFSTGLPSLQEEPILLGGDLRSAIDRCFTLNTVEDIIKALENETEQKEWAQKTLKTLSTRSPTSLKVTLRQLRLGRNWGIAETFQREHQIAAQFMKHPDFVEGVKSRLISKPPTEPGWQPAKLSEVYFDVVDDFFKVTKGSKLLELFNDGNYAHYPHAKFALPSETDIVNFIRENNKSRREIFNDFLQKWGHKEGLLQKLSEVTARRAQVGTNGRLKLKGGDEQDK